MVVDDAAGEPSPGPEAEAGTPGEEGIEVTVDDGLAVVRINRPPHNLLTEPALRLLADALEELEGKARAVVVCSEGRSFCAGANFRSAEAPNPSDPETFEKLTGAFYEQAARVFDCPLPLVAAVQGAAIGAGFGLALACDIRVVGESGWFQANFVRLGIHPGFALSATLPHVVGPGRAADIFLTGRRVGAAEAERIGLAQEVTSDGDLLDRARALAGVIAAAAPLAVRATRTTLRRGLAGAARATMRQELAEQTALAGTADAIEGMAAMLEGRHPHFEGR